MKWREDVVPYSPGRTSSRSVCLFVLMWTRDSGAAEKEEEGVVEEEEEEGVVVFLRIIGAKDERLRSAVSGPGTQSPEPEEPLASDGRQLTTDGPSLPQANR